MRQLAILTFLSLDGVMQAPMSAEEDPSGDFNHGGWAAPFYGEVMNQVMQEAMHEPYDMLFGRKTFNQFASYWPTVDASDPVASMMNRAKKWVVTHSGNHLPWQNTEIIQNEVTAQIANLKKQSGPILQIHGSWKLIQSLLDADLIDEYRLWTFPVILGSGKRLFANPQTLQTLNLVKASSSANGVLMSIYRKPTSPG